jgi:hypothetical protein
MVISGKPHRVLLVSGRVPSHLTDFEAAQDFVIDMESTQYEVRGTGSRLGDEVR